MAIRSIVWKTLPLWLAIAAGLVAIGSVLLAELRGHGTSTAGSSTLAESDVVLTGFHLTTSSNGRVQWEVRASRARFLPGGHQALLEDIRGTSRPPDGSMIEFEGASGSFDMTTRDAVIEGSDGGVVVRLPDGYQLRTDRLTWSDGPKEVSSDRVAYLTGPRLAISGSGLLARPRVQEFTFLRDVHARVF
ncbi:MAG: LPS export ABC transporter periplasmic protein LptC [Nitrospiria bacterium]